MTREEMIMNRVHQHLDELNKRIAQNNLECEVFGIFLQGSQNYNLDEYSDEYMSDVDTKAIVIPSLSDLVFNHRYSETIILDNNEHIDIKDIQSVVECWTKQNSSYLELLFTPFCIVNEKYNEYWNQLVENRERIARIDPARHAQATKGSMYSKYKALCHPAPHSAATIEKLGYDPKELCHIIRYHDELFRYVDDIKGKRSQSFYNYLLGCDGEQDEYLMRVKKGLEYTKEEAIDLAEHLNNAVVTVTDEFVATNPKKDEEMFTFLKDFTFNIINEYINSNNGMQCIAP